jgi:hypothetical protein
MTNLHFISYPEEMSISETGLSFGERVEVVVVIVIN